MDVKCYEPFGSIQIPTQYHEQNNAHKRRISQVQCLIGTRNIKLIMTITSALKGGECRCQNLRKEPTDWEYFCVWNLRLEIFKPLNFNLTASISLSH